MRVLVDDSVLSKVDAIPDESSAAQNSVQQHDLNAQRMPQMQQNSQNSHSVLDGANQYAPKDILSSIALSKNALNALEKSRLPKAGLGLLQGAYDVVKSAGDLPLKLAGQSIPDVDLSQYGPQDGISRLAFLGGETLAQGGGEYGLYKALGKIPALAGKGLATSIGKGAIAAGTLGEEQPGGRVGAAITGGILGPLTELGAKSVADTSVALRKGAISQYNHLYNTMFKDIENSGVKKVELNGKINTKLINKLPSSKDQLESLNNFINNPTFQNAHTAQSELGKLIAKSNPYALSDVKKNALDEAIRAQGMIKNSFVSTLEKRSQPELAQRFKDITAGYAKDVVPYNHKAIRKYQAGRMDPSVLVKILSRDKDFVFDTKQSFPQLLNRKKAVVAGKYAANQLQDIGKYIGLGSLLYGAGKGAASFNDSSGNNP